MANGEEQIDVQAENGQQAVGLAQRAARILHNLPFLNFPAIAPNEGELDLGHLDRDFHVLVHNANAVLAEQLAVLGELVFYQRLKFYLTQSVNGFFYSFVL